MYYLTEGHRCFIAKSQVEKIPILGSIAGIMQTIFVDRADKNSRLEVMTKLSNRIERIKQGARLNKVVIFAEGTVSNGEALL